MSLAAPSCAAQTRLLASEHGLDDLVRASAQTLAPSSFDPSNVSRCTLLAVAGTGSTTLATLVTRISPRLAHHAHYWLPHSLAAKKGASCFIVTLRDPAARFVSAFNFEAWNSWPPTGSARLSSRPGSKHPISPQQWMDSFRTTTECSTSTGCTATAGIDNTKSEAGASLPWWTVAMGNATRAQYESSMPGVMRHVVLPFEARDAHSGKIGAVVDGPGAAMGAGSPFLVPQVAYLADFVADDAEGRSSASGVGRVVLRLRERNANHTSTTVGGSDGRVGDAVRLHFLCASSRYQGDWQRLLAAYDLDLNAPQNLTQVQKLRGASSVHSVAHSLSPAARAYLRECMYPLDWRLYRRVCLDGDANGAVQRGSGGSKIEAGGPNSNSSGSRHARRASAPPSPPYPPAAPEPHLPPAPAAPPSQPTTRHHSRHGHLSRGSVGHTVGGDDSPARAEGV